MLNDLLRGHKARLQGQTELRAQQSTQRSVRILSGNMVGNDNNVIGGVSARVYENGVYGFASAAEYTDESIAKVLAAAGENAKFLGKRGGRGLSALAPIKSGDVAPAKTGGEPEQKVLIDYVKELDAYIGAKYPNLAARFVVANCLDMEKLLVTSDGADSHSLTPRSLIQVTLTALDKEGTPVDLYQSFGGYGFFNEKFSAPAELADKIAEQYEHLMKKAEGVFADAGYKQVVMGPDLAGILAHEAVGHTVESDIVLGGSVAADLLNQQVASPLVTLIDYAHHCDGKICPVPVFVDDEGVIAEDTVIIENGILKRYMNNRLNALQMGMPVTGNARAFLFSDEPLVRMRNTAIVPGKDKLLDMIASVEDGYYLMKSGNGQADTTGEFMFGITLGYEIKNGKLGRAIKDTTIAGLAFDMLKTVDMVSDDMSWTAAGMCGKKQPIPVGMGGPAVRCKIGIGGR